MHQKLKLEYLRESETRNNNLDYSYDLLYQTEIKPKECIACLCRGKSDFKIELQKSQR